MDTKKKTIRFLLLTFTIVIGVCVGALVLFTRAMSEKSEKTVNEIGTIYMSGLNERIAMQFESAMESHLDDVEELLELIPLEKTTSLEELYSSLRFGAQARDMHCLALYMDDGSFDVIWGDRITLADPEPFLESVMQGEKKISLGKTISDGKEEEVVVLGVPAEYPMKNGRKSVALTGCFSVDELKELLVLDNDSSLVYSHVIRRDGSFIIKTGENEEDNYFEVISRYLLKNSEKSPETYVKELQEAMEKNEDYSALFYLKNDRRHLHCTSLPYSEWYLITVMPYGMLDDTVNRMDTERFCFLIICVVVILAVLITVFVKYFKLTQRQIHELEETRLEAVRANKAKSEFLSNLSHDIRTPMNGILGMTAIAVKNIDDKPQVENCLKKITISGRHLLGLINDILDMAKIESGKLTLSEERISLLEVMEEIRDIVQIQIMEKNQEFDLQLEDVSEEYVYCDSVRLNQILLNLLSNAMKFTPEGGSIRVLLREEPSPAGEEYVQVHLYVKDNGIGIHPDFQEKIFESFSREDNKRVHKTEGTGLGMTITKYIVDAMEGRISVQSEQGKGTEFHIVLDLKKAESPSVENAEKKQEYRTDFNGAKLLVAEDNDLNWEIAEELLSMLNLELEWAENGSVCVEKFSQSPNGYYSAVLMDLRMPVMNGFEAAKEIRSLSRADADIPIIAMTADAFAEDVQKCMDCGMNAHVAKPIDLKEIARLLDTYIGGTI